MMALYFIWENDATENKYYLRAGTFIWQEKLPESSLMNKNNHFWADHEKQIFSFHEILIVPKNKIKINKA